MNIKTCHNCGVEEGQLHKFGCDMERCPFCGNQLISCDCCYDFLGFNFNPVKPFYNLPEDIYQNGLTEKLEDKWLEILKEKGRIPYISYPIVCAKCGCLWPDLFIVSDEEWKYYIQPDMRKEVICLDCYNHVKTLIDKNR